MKKEYIKPQIEIVPLNIEGLMIGPASAEQGDGTTTTDQSTFVHDSTGDLGPSDGDDNL